MKTIFFTVSIVTAALLVGSQNLRADHLAGAAQSEKSANAIIGRKVVNTQNENLGKVQDLIINVDSGRVPYAVIATGGMTSRTKVAVPLSSLHCSTDGKSAMIISATKEELQAASKTPSGAWAPAANSEWAKNVNGFYGQSTASERFGRGAFRDADGSRTYVRDPAPKGAELLATPQDTALSQKISEKVDILNVQVQNGVAHLYGQVDNDETRQKLENQVRSVDGVTRVESHLRIKSQQP